ncbi:MAG: heparinase II/III family protein [bacterium]|nr:heparinase II/III family protein [bacterium]
MFPNTRAYLTFDKEYLYVGFDCDEPEMSTLKKADLWREGVEIFLTSSTDKKNYFHIGITPNGSHAAYAGAKSLGKEEDEKIKIGTHLYANSWSAEIAVPFALSSLPSPDTVWKICLARSRKSISHNTWPCLSGNSGYHDPDYFADLYFTGDPLLMTAGPSDRKVSVKAAGAGIDIDGKLEESAWINSARITGFVQLSKADPRLIDIKSRVDIEKLVEGRYKEHGFSTSLSKEDFERVRETAGTVPWAQAAFDRIKRIADYWAAKPDEELYALIPAENPRAFAACYSFGCPICGTGKGWYATTALATTLETPNRWRCVTCGRWFGPGEEVEYDTGKGIVKYRITDDGMGWKVPDGLPGSGKVCYFVAAWRQYLLNALLGSNRAKDVTVEGHEAPVGGLEALATVYAVTGETAYAHKALLILTRIAQLHPAYDGVIDIGNPFIMPHIAWTTGGAEEIVDSCVYSYDIVFDSLPRDRELVKLFKNKGHEDWNSDGQITAEDLRRSIDVNLFGYMYEWLLRVRSASQESDWVIAQCGQMVSIGRLLENPHIVWKALEGEEGFCQLLIDRTINDGRFFYNSLNYHFGKPPYFGRVLFDADGYKDGEVFKKAIDLFNDNSLPFRRLLDYAAGIMCSGRIPGIGDQPIPRQKVDLPGNENLLASMALLITKYPHLAYKVANKELLINALIEMTKTALPRQALELIVNIPRIESIMRDAVYQPQGTELFTDSGLAILRTDSDDNGQVHTVLNYGIEGSSHSHYDQLALNIIAHGYELTINKGYPYTWVSNAKVPDWILNTAAQNVVRIDGVNQTAHDLLNMPIEDCAGKLHAFTDNETAAIADGSDEKVYPGLASLYRRAVYLVKDPLHPFVVDIYNVAGGSTRDYQFHAQSDSAGKNFALALGDGAGMKSVDKIPKYIDDRFIYDLAEAKTSGGITARWWIGDKDNTGLVLHMLPGEQMRTVITGKGQAEGGDNSVPCDAHITIREEGAVPSRFVSLLIPYRGSVPEYKAEEMKLVLPADGAASATALCVFVGERNYLIFHSLEDKKIYTFVRGGHTYTFSGICAVIAESDDHLKALSLSGGRCIGRDKEVFQIERDNEGKVISINLEEKSITVQGMDGGFRLPALIKWLDRPWTYRVLKTEKVRSGLKLYLDTLSLLDKGCYPMIREGDKIVLLNELYISRNKKDAWQIESNAKVSLKR